MTAQRVPVWIVACDACDREFGQGYGHRETFDTQQDAEQAARDAGWTRHPDGTHYCQEGQHQ